MSMKFRLREVIMANSTSKEYQEACREWEITDARRDNDSTCVCGKKHIKNVFVIRNTTNDKVLDPIGCSCVRFFFTKEQMKAWKELKKKLKNK